ncbi:WD40/YVTN/BNR-like repeat-containing protein [Thermincola ferriacetica]
MLVFLSGCRTSGNHEKSFKEPSNNKNPIKTVLPLPQKPELFVFWIKGNKALARHNEYTKPHNSSLYTSDDFTSFSLLKNFSGSAGEYYVSPDNEQILFFTGDSNSTLKGIWKSTDQGKNWYNVFEETVDKLFFVQNDSFQIYALKNRKEVGADIFVSKDNGETWYKESTIKDVASASRLAVNPFNQKQKIITARNGLWVTSDNGITWTNKYSESEPTGVAFNPCNPNEAYFTSHFGLYQISYGKINKINFSEKDGIPVPSSLIFKPDSSTAYFLSETDKKDLYKVNSKKVDKITTFESEDPVTLIFDSANPDILFCIGLKEIVKLSFRP